MVHLRVELVRVASCFVGNVDWGNRAVLLITVISDKCQQTKVFVVALPGIPILLEFTSFEGF
jgi:hypothetical protein